jgi:uncharacterized membrane protein
LTDITYLALLFVHIGTVVLWMGASILYVSVLGPSMTRLAPSSRADLFNAIGSRYERYLVSNATIAVAAGLILYAYVSGDIVKVTSNIALSSSGMPWIMVGIVLGLIAYIIGIAIVMRANRGLMKLMAQAPAGQPSSAMSSTMLVSLQRRVVMGSGLQALLLLIALLCMVVGANI